MAMAANSLQGIKSSTVSPAYLHTNSTIHTRPFSAIAELIDNAYDPDVNASELCIDLRIINGNETLSFVDNGSGMDHEKLYKMLSFGYCEKVRVGNRTPIGCYGNGFKSGSMRLGKDALVFTRCTSSTSVGFLSQTYLKAINVDEVKVPIVTWDNKYPLTRKLTPEMNANLKAILSHSIFNREEDLFEMLKYMENKHRTGTNIIISNLRKNQLGANELDFVSDPEDIRNPETTINDLTSIIRPIHSASAEYKKSLRVYCSILFLKPKMKIVLRGVKVRSILISKSLSQTEKDVYKPTWLTNQVRLIFGFTSSKEPESYGMMLYHKNRLIKAFEKVGCQTKATGQGVGVVGVVEANFLEPVHDKQDFVRNDHYKSFIENCGKKLNDYYFEKTQSENPGDSLPQSDPWTWAQCDNCQKWRRLPTEYSEQLPDKWFCKDNPDSTFNRCEIPEEPEDDDEALKVSYKKTYQKNQREKKRRARIEEEKRAKEKQLNSKQGEKSAELTGRIEDSAGPSSSPISPRSSFDFPEESEDDDEALKVSNKKTYQKNQRGKKRRANREEEKNKKIKGITVAGKRKSSELTDRIEDSAGPSSSTVSTRSRGVFAKGPDGKKVKITQEKDATVSLEDDDSVIDLISDEDDNDLPMTGGASNSEMSQNDSDGDYTEIEAILEEEIEPDNIELAGASKEERKMLVHEGSQTEPIIDFDSPKENGLLELKNMLSSKNRELDECQRNMKSLQDKISRLLSIIQQPDFDWGQPENIENFIQEFIQLSRSQHDS